MTLALPVQTNPAWPFQAWLISAEGEPKAAGAAAAAVFVLAARTGGMAGVAAGVTSAVVADNKERSWLGLGSEGDLRWFVPFDPAEQPASLSPPP